MNHLMNKVDRLYKKPLEIIGLWHRHPGSFDQFSGTDDGTNIKYARRHQDGAVSALVNIDPNFRITMYHITDPLSYRKVKYTVGDKYFPPEFLAYATRKKYLNQINHPNGLENGLLSKLKKWEDLLTVRTPVSFLPTSTSIGSSRSATSSTSTCTRKRLRRSARLGIWIRTT